ncbi:hypothetical protein GA0115251_10417, partial [Streptomyces sp. TverLS-915]
MTRPGGPPMSSPTRPHTGTAEGGRQG